MIDSNELAAWKKGFEDGFVAASRLSMHKALDDHAKTVHSRRAFEWNPAEFGNSGYYAECVCGFLTHACSTRENALEALERHQKGHQ